MTSKPDRLYKFMPFNARALTILTSGNLYYASPSTFNDPLDSVASIIIDCSIKQLEELGAIYQQPDIGGEYNSYAPIEFRHDIFAKINGRLLTPSDGADYIGAFRNWLKDIVKSAFSGTGILSLSASWSQVLPWSHYADQHQGICIELEPNWALLPNLAPVKYVDERGVRVSDMLEEQFHNSLDAKHRIVDSLLYTKAPAWRYEDEWRDTTNSYGLRRSLFRISGVYFGLRCEQAVISSIMLLMNNMDNISFYKISVGDDSFELARSEQILF